MQENWQNYRLDPERSRLGRFSAVLLFIFAVLALGLMLGTPSLHRSEAACVEAVRRCLDGSFGMFDHADCGVLYGYLAAFFSWYGGVVNELSLRLPAMLAALVVLTGTVLIGRKIFDSTVAMSGAWMLLSSGAFLLSGRAARPEMLSAALVTSALVILLYSAENPRFGDFLFFYLIVALGIVGRNWVAAALIVLAALPFLRVGGRWKKQLKFSNLAALVMVLAALAAWFSWHGEAESWRDWYSRVLAGELRYRSLTQLNYEPLAIYCGDVLRLSLPWTPLVLIGIFAPFPLWPRYSDDVRALSVSVLLCLGFLMILPVDRYGYLLCISSLIMLLGANGVAGRVRSEYIALLASQVTGWIVAAAALLAVASLPLEFYWPRIFGFKLPWVLVVFLPVLGIAALLTILLDFRDRGRTLSAWTGMSARLAGPVLAGAIMTCGTFALLWPSLEKFRTRKPFLQRMQLQTGDMPVIFWGTSAPDSLAAFYLNHGTVAGAADNAEALQKLLNQLPGREVLILSGNEPLKLESLAQALYRCGFPPRLGAPDYREMPQMFEHPDNHKLAAWRITLEK